MESFLKYILDNIPASSGAHIHSDVFLRLFHKIQHVVVLVDYYTWKQNFVTLCFFASLFSLITMLHMLIFNKKIFIRKYFSIFVNFFRWLTTRSGEVNQIFYSLNIFRKKQHPEKKYCFSKPLFLVSSYSSFIYFSYFYVHYFFFSWYE